MSANQMRAAPGDVTTSPDPRAFLASSPLVATPAGLRFLMGTAHFVGVSGADLFAAVAALARLRALPLDAQRTILECLSELTGIAVLVGADHGGRPGLMISLTAEGRTHTLTFDLRTGAVLAASVVRDPTLWSVGDLEALDLFDRLP